MHRRGRAALQGRVKPPLRNRASAPVVPPISSAARSTISRGWPTLAFCARVGIANASAWSPREQERCSQILRALTDRVYIGSKQRSQQHRTRPSQTTRRTAHPLHKCVNDSKRRATRRSALRSHQRTNHTPEGHPKLAQRFQRWGEQPINRPRRDGTNPAPKGRHNLAQDVSPGSARKKWNRVPQGTAQSGASSESKGGGSINSHLQRKQGLGTNRRALREGEKTEARPIGRCPPLSTEPTPCGPS